MYIYKCTCVHVYVYLPCIQIKYTGKNMAIEHMTPRGVVEVGDTLSILSNTFEANSPQAVASGNSPYNLNVHRKNEQADGVQNCKNALRDATEVAARRLFLDQGNTEKESSYRSGGPKRQHRTRNQEARRSNPFP